MTAYSLPAVYPSEKMVYTPGFLPVLRRGQPIYFNERAASNKLLAEHVPLIVDLHAGKARARYWTCDFTAEYVRINASYRT